MAQWVVGIGNNLDLMQQLPDNKIHCVVTSPPYFHLRDYETPPVAWGGDPYCDHDWGDPEGPRCLMCPAWRGELGQEKDPELFVQHLTRVFQEVKRILHPQGSLWLNIGDAYAGSGNGPSGNLIAPSSGVGPALVPTGYKAKDMMGVPWMLAESLRASGWWLRSQVIWHKPNAKPNSYQDRPVTDYEPVYLFTKSPSYYYDYFNSLEPSSNGEGQRATRSVWSIPTRDSGFPHYACFPKELPKKLISLSCPEQVCAQCGAPYNREVEIIRDGENIKEGEAQRKREAISGGARGVTLGRKVTRIDHGLKPSCDCKAGSLPGLVLDPFGGLMTTGEAALELNRRFLGLEANSIYAGEGKARLTALTLSGNVR